MPRRALGARLYLRKERNGKKTWIIRDNNCDARTGFGEHERKSAEALLADYLSGRFKPVREKPLGFIYFLTCIGSEHYPIKIGWSNTPIEARVAQLQGGNPNLLTVLGLLTGSMEDEQNLHRRFGHLRIRGEWFVRNGELIDYIGGLPGAVEVYGADEFDPARARPFNARAQLQQHHEADNVNETWGIGGTNSD